MSKGRKFIAAGAIPLFALAAIFAIQSAQSPCGAGIYKLNVCSL